MQNFQEHMEYYRQQHSTLGCKITHMFGIPLIAVSVPMLFFQWKVAILLFVVGWALQFIGHIAFEKNRPVFLSDIADPRTYVSALLFAAEEWGKLLSGKPLVESV